MVSSSKNDTKGSDQKIEIVPKAEDYVSFPILPEQEQDHKPLGSLLKTTLKKVTANATTAVQSYLPQSQSQSQTSRDSKILVNQHAKDSDRQSIAKLQDVTGTPGIRHTSINSVSSTNLAHLKSTSTVQLDIDDSELASVSTTKDDIADSTKDLDISSISNSYSSFNDDKIPKVRTDGKSLRLSTIDLPNAKPNITSISILKNEAAAAIASPVINDISNQETSFQKISTLFKNLPNDIELSDDSSMEETVDESSFSLFGFKANINPLKDGGISKQHWMDDAFATECLNCQKSFTAFRRKHHCRFCGQIFCHDCTLFVTKRQAKNGKIRVCKPCYNDVIVYLSDESDGEESTATSSRRNSHGLRTTNSKNSILQNKDFIKNGDDKGTNVRFEENSIFKKTPSTLDNEDNSDIEKAHTEQTPNRYHNQTILSPDGENLVFTAPTPPPRMAIPTTRKGEAVEIPVTRSYGSKFSNASHSTRRGRLFDVHHRQLRENRSSDTLSIASNSNTLSMPKANDTISLEQESNFTDDELGSESEDEQAMSLYTSLNNDYDFNRNEGLRLPRNLNNDEEKNEKGNNIRSNERAYASLLRMRSRRKSKSVSRPNRSQANLTKVLSQNDSSFIPIVSSNASTSVTSNINVTGTTKVETVPTIENVVKTVHNDKSSHSTSVKFSTPNRSIRTVFENHLSTLLDQCLADGEIKSTEKWKKVINNALDSIDLIDISDTLDIKQYVKTKKILGGRISDTAVIDGIFMTKDVDLKYMPGKIYNPKIALIMFPIEYLKTKEQFVSLKLITSQESVYINNIVQKLISLKPDIVVCGESVSGLAEKVLETAGISVISNVKPQVIERISRYTKAGIFSTVNDLFFKQGSLGTCKIFEVRKYLYKDLIKTFLFFTGCSFESGFTMALRGGDEDVLTSIKYAAETMIVAKFNERFERKLFENQCVAFLNQGDAKRMIAENHSHINEISDTGESNNELVQGDSPNSLALTDNGNFAQDYIRLCQERKLSVSPCVQFPLPYILKNVKEAEAKLIDFRKKYAEINDATSLKDISPLTVEDLNINIDFDDLPNKEYDLLAIYKYISDIKLASLQSNFNFRSRTWNNCMSYPSYQLYPVFHKNITFLYSMVSTKNATPCVGPNTGHIDYYTDNDRCLGLFLDQIFLEASNICNECGDSHFDHFKSYVHGNGKLDVVLEKIHKIPSQNDERKNKRMMWSYCKKCHTSTPMIKMSDEAYCFSFGKYLELSFWGKSVKVLGYSCSHDYFKDHIRYFGLNDLAIRMEYSQVDTFEVVIPRKQLEYKPEKDIQLKVETYSQIRDKTKRFFNSILARLNRVKVDTIDKMDEGLNRIEELKAKVQEQSGDIERKILEIYNSTATSVHLPLNSILRSVQELSVYWDSEFQDFEKQFLPTEKDITRITQFHLKKFLLDKYHSEEDKEVELNDISKNKLTSEKDALKNDDDEKSGSSELSEKVPNSEEGNGNEESRELIGEGNEQNTSGGKKSTVLEKISRMEALLENEKSVSTDVKTHKRNVSGSEDIKPFRTGINRTISAPVTPATSKIPVRQPNVPFKPSSSPGTPISKLPTPSASTSALASQIPRLSTNTKELENQLNESGQNSQSSTSNKVMHLASLFDQLHFDQISKEFEREREKERRKLNRYRAIPVGSSKPIVEIYKKIEDAVDVDVDVDENFSDDESNMKPKRARSDEMRPRALKKNNTATSINQIKRTAGDISPSKMTPSPPKNLNDSIQNIERIIQDSDLHDPSLANKKRKNNSNSDIGDSTTTQPQTPKLDENIDGEKDTITAGDAESIEIPQPEKLSLLKTLTNFWADRSATLWEPLEYPLSSSEHTFVDSDVIVREDEPSSLIAFCLSSTDYKQKIKSMRDDSDVTILSNEIHSKKAAHFSKIEKKFKESGKEESELEKIMGKLNTTHLKYQYLDGQSILSCKIFYSEQFEAFRKACGCDENFIQSLSRCVKWDSSGGKSGSSFLKTLDNRFIIKELSKSELESFVAIAPFYFKYMSQSMFNTLTTAIAKIFGFYQIHIKNPLTGKNFRMDFLIMENLFYDRKTTRIFDLKGSMRNRHVEQTGKENEVLLDENMVEYIYESPLFVREHSKRLLRGSLFNDTAFLSAMDVMDYSLVIGIDDSNNKKLYVGIIDCIRTFTWDKKVENWVKGSNLIGGGKGKDPTIVTPKQYRTRFREAMERYILEVPDCWYEGKHDRVVNYQ